VEYAFFRRAGDLFEPLDLSRSRWNREQVHGMAVSGLLSLAAENAAHELGRDDLIPARLHVDLFRPARMVPTEATARVVRNGPRVLLVDAEIRQADEPVARASVMFLLPTEDTPGEVWASPDRGTPPPLELAAISEEPRVPLFQSASPWSNDFGDHQNAGRHASWQVGMEVVLGETPSTFQALASVVDVTSMVTNWGSAGVEYINADVDVAVSRRPVSREIGLRTLDRTSHDGVCVGAAEVYDRSGTLGTATVVALANTKRAIDFSSTPRDYVSD